MMSLPTPERDGKPPVVRHFRTLHYHSLSNDADVIFVETDGGSVHWELRGKAVEPLDS